MTQDRLSFVPLINQIWPEINKPDVIVKGFSTLGLWPFDKSKVLDKYLAQHNHSIHL